MPEHLIKKICARTHIMIDKDNLVNQGSGVIVKDDDDFYLITAEHCIYGEKDEHRNVVPENIIVEVQDSGYDSDFRRIKVIDIIESNKNDDWVLIQIENPNIQCDYLRIFKGHNFIEEDAAFIGYQNMNKDQFRKFEVDLIDISEKSFKVTLKNGSFSLPGEEGAFVAKGLSGSGVFIRRGNKLYLIGHLKSVIGDAAVNDDIICCHIKKIENLFKNKCTDLSDLQEISAWDEEVEASAIEKDIELWKKEKVDEFDNILRKHHVLYPDGKAEKITHERITDFFASKHKIEVMRRSNSKSVSDFEESANVFEKRVRETYTMDANRKEAKELSRQLEEDFSNFIKDIYNDKSNRLNTELARVKITEWFMNCSFDFVE